MRRLTLLVLMSVILFMFSGCGKPNPVTSNRLFILWNGTYLSGAISLPVTQTIFVIPVNILIPGNNQTVSIGAFKDPQLTGPAPTISIIHGMQAQAAISVEDTPVLVNVR